MKFIVVLTDPLTFLVQGITAGTPTDEIQSPADVRLPMNQIGVFSQLIRLEQPFLRINGIVGAAAGKIIGTGKIIPVFVQIRIGKTVCVNKNGFIIGRAYQQFKFVPVGIERMLQQHHIVKQSGVFIFPITHDGEGHGILGVQPIGHQKVPGELVIQFLAGGKGNKASGHEDSPLRQISGAFRSL